MRGEKNSNESTTSKANGVGVVIPAYNASSFLPEAIESVLDQTHPVDEIVVVDDGSTDSTRQIVERYASQGVRYIWQANQGSPSARNTGIEAIDSAFVSFLDADDLWCPNKTKAQLGLFMRSPDVVMVSGDQIFWDPDRSIKKLRRFSDNKAIKYFENKLIFSNLVGNPSMTMVRRSALDEAGFFDRALRFGDDWDMWLRIAAVGKVDFVAEPVAIYRWHRDNLSQRHQAACLAAYRNIARRAIHRSLPPLSWPMAYLSLVKHTELFFRYKSWRATVGSVLRRLSRANEADNYIS